MDNSEDLVIVNALMRQGLVVVEEVMGTNLFGVLPTARR